LKRLEAFARVAEFLPEATLLVRADGTVLAANRRSASLLDGVRPAELIGRRLAEITDQDDDRSWSRPAKWSSH
jgi:PAS domain-containing protein